MTTNVDVTLPDGLPRIFLCPLCFTGLDVRGSRKGKPYCVCNTCGIQLFFRGKNAIELLRGLAERVAIEVPYASSSAATFELLERLRAQRERLVDKRPLILADKHLENAIVGVDREIARIEIQLDTIARGIANEFDQRKTATQK